MHGENNVKSGLEVLAKRKNFSPYRDSIITYYLQSLAEAAE
jgi:hypothetical protein